jgi:hypothetical protein
MPPLSFNAARLLLGGGIVAVVAVLGFRRVHLADRRSTRSYSLTRSDYFVTRGSFWGISGVASVWGGYVGSGYGWRGGARGGGDRCSVGTLYTTKFIEIESVEAN